AWGAGRGGRGGLYDYEIRNYMKYLYRKGFDGVFPIDTLDFIKVNPKYSHFSFILTKKKSGCQDGHWVAVYVDKNNIEYYDSFGQDPSAAIVKELKKVIRRFTKKKLQFKINRIRFQRINSDNCGYFAMKF